MTAPVVDLHDDVVVVALHELRATRRQRRLGDWHAIDALYRAYLAAVVGGLAVTILSGVVGDRRLPESALGDVRSAGPAALGLVVAVALAFGLRSGARGGPLALEAADVRYVLLAPVDRDVALRRPALRQLRFSAFAGAVTGAVIGLLAYRRFPGSPFAWIGAGALVGGSTAVAMAGSAMIASGRRLSRRVATGLGAALAAWSLADLAARRVTSPASFAGEISLWPLLFRPAGAVALVLSAALAAAGLTSIGGLSLEAAERRGRLVTHLRFAATFQDLRTVMLLRRQLSAELPRSKPWLRLRPARRGPTAWRRDWRGILRWPAVRLVRLTALGVVGGLAAAAAWAGTTALVLVAGLALFVAGLDAIEGLAQEVDHPDRRDEYPTPAGALHLRHLAAPAVVVAAVWLVGVLAAAAAATLTSEPVLEVFKIGVPLAFPAGAAAAGAAAVSALRAPPDPSRLMADSTGMGLLFHHALPPGLAMGGPVGLLLVHSQLRRAGADPLVLAVNAAVNVALLAALIFGWVRHRQGIGGFFSGEGLSGAGPGR